MGLPGPAKDASDVRGGRLPNIAKYDVVEEIGHGGMATVEEKARAFLLHVTARAPRWYAPHHGEAEGFDGQEEPGAA